jgi:uncharacterized protein YgiM (DUF1202 family)
MLKTTIFAAAALVAVGLAAPASAERMSPASDSAIQLAQGAAPAATTGRITGRGVRLRAEASATGRVITRLSRGTRVTVLGRSGDYTQVRVGQRTGYVASQYVQ